MFTLHSSFLSALLLSGSSAPAPTDYSSCHPKFMNPTGCEAVRWNNAGTPPGGAANGLWGGMDTPIQFVSLAPSTGRIYMAYSTLQGPNPNPEGPPVIRKNNVLMTVLELACGEDADILVFGTGYGCRIIGEVSTAEWGPEFDAGLVNNIVRNCMGLQGPLRVAFVVPHGHPDHFNPEFIYALQGLGGYVVDRIYVHVDDEMHLNQIGMGCPGPLVSAACSAACEAVNCTNNNFGCWPIETFGQPDCCNGAPWAGEPICPDPTPKDCESAWDSPGVLSFRSTQGRVWFRGRDGHTPGSVDLVLDHKDGSGRQFVVWGSMIPGCQASNCGGDCDTIPDCPPLPGFQWAIPAHGNIPVVLPPASYPCPSCP